MGEENQYSTFLCCHTVFWTWMPLEVALFAFCCMVAQLHCQILKLTVVSHFALCCSSLGQEIQSETESGNSNVCNSRQYNWYHPKRQLEGNQKYFTWNSELLLRCKGGRCHLRYSFRRQAFTLFLSRRPVVGLRSLKIFFPRCSAISYGPRYWA